MSSAKILNFENEFSIWYNLFKIMMRGNKMLKLRNYEKSDAEYIATWCENKTIFHMWCADEYDKYPITAEDINEYYENEGKDINYKLTAFDESGIVGHFTLRTIAKGENEIRLEFVIVNNKRRGQGLGKKIVRLALDYARENLNAKKVTLEVFENNLSAYKCYKSVGFKEYNPPKTGFYNVLGEKWICRKMEYKF